MPDAKSGTKTIRMTVMGRILVVEDEDFQRTELADFLREVGHEVFEAQDGRSALESARNQQIDIAILDKKLPDFDGLQLISELKKLNPEVDVVIVTAYGTIDTAVQAIKLGAYDFITKPVDLEELQLKIDRILEKRRLQAEIRLLRDELRRYQRVGEIVYKSKAMEQVMEIVRRVAPTGTTVLITGESGTGKELIARAIHILSGRKGRFVPVSCAAIPEHLIESELFGYEKGAFTGAVRSKPGKFELAHQGTLFLDEIGEMPLNLQVKLLRVLQDKEIERLGSTKAVKVDIRIVAATNRELEKLVKEGKFREDLFYRLNVVRIHIPPLRERREDIIPLAEHFLKVFSREMHKPIEGFSREAKQLLLSYDWPGNVRELQNAVERAVVLTRYNFIMPEDLPIARTSDSDRVQSLRLEDVERAHIKKVLEMTEYNISRAAELLGIHRNTLREKMKRYGLVRPESGS